MGKAKKKERKNKKSKQKICTFKHFFIPLHSLLRDKANGDPLAQLVEHNTFNVGVLGSSPKRITKQKGYYLYSILFLLYICSKHIWDQWKFSGDKHKSLQVDTERTFHQRYPLVML